MQTDAAYKPLWFVVFAWVMVMWNLLVATTFIMHFIAQPSTAKLASGQEALYQNEPWWSLLAFGVAGFAGLLGAGAMMLGKRWAMRCYMVSLIGVLVQQFYTFYLTDGLTEMGKAALAMPAFVLVLTLLQIGVASFGNIKRWLV